VALVALLNVDESDRGWVPGGDYVLTANHVLDVAGNVIAPDSRIAVAQPFFTNTVPATACWSSHAAYSADPTVYEQPWQTAGFVENSIWISGVGPFCGGALPNPPCLGDCETATAYQLSPTLFRTTFLWPEGLLDRAVLMVSGAVDDGLVLLLNGLEIWRTNAAGNSGTSISVTSYAATGRRDPGCFTDVPILLPRLPAGTNVLAAAVLQPLSATEFDCAFVLVVTGQGFRAPPLLEEPVPALQITVLNENAARLSWSGGGYAVESTTNLTLGALSYPFGPWLQVSNMSNPYTNDLAEPARFFRLKK
jgi:hypothetical protein